jgi:7-cyano-7-deazaguanine reductase
MPKKENSRQYTDEHARAGIKADLPAIETWDNQYPGYVIQIQTPEFTSVCPKTGLPDHGEIVVEYVPDKLCLELKALKLYMIAYRNIGIFQENAVNRILRDVVDACDPLEATVTGEFTPRGGVYTKITAAYQRSAKGRRSPKGSRGR